MTICRGTSFTGNNSDSLGVAEPIKASTLKTLADDQAFGYEKISSRNATGSGASTVARHTHEEAGNIVFLPLGFQQFGCNGTQQFSAYDGITEQHQSAYVLQSIQGTTAAVADFRVMAMLVYVPASFTANSVVCCALFHVDGDPRFEVNVYDSGMVLITGGSRIRAKPAETLPTAGAMVLDGNMGGAELYGVEFTPTSAGLHVVEVMTTINTYDERRVIHSMSVFGVVDPNTRGPIVDVSNTYPSNTVTVGDPDASNAWSPVDDIFFSADSPAHTAGTVMLTTNAARTYELATGVPAPGQSSLTVAQGHDHYGPSSERNDEIKMSHFTCALGGMSGQLSTAAFEIFGNRSLAPRPVNGTGHLILSSEFFMHDAANVTVAGGSRLLVAMLVEVQSGKGGNVMEVGTTVGATTQATTCNESASLQIKLAATANEFTPNAVNQLIVTARLSTLVDANARNQVLSVCVYTHY